MELLKDLLIIYEQAEKDIIEKIENRINIINKFKNMKLKEKRSFKQSRNIALGSQVLELEELIKSITGKKTNAK